MSHGDQVVEAPAGFEVLASTETTPVAAFANSERKIYGVQWHPEVKHSQFGQDVLVNFLHNAAGIPATWNSGNVIAEQVEKIRAQVGDARVICGLSGGVDSAVAAAIVHKAVGDQLVCVFVNHGLLRQDEATQVERDYVAATGIRLVTVDAEQKFLEALAGVSDPETKRKIIGREFIRTFEEAERAWWPRLPLITAQSSSWFRARSTQTWLSRVAALPPESRATTTWVASPMTCSLSW